MAVKVIFPSVVKAEKPFELIVHFEVPQELWGRREFQLEIFRVGTARNELALIIADSMEFKQNCSYVIRQAEPLPDGFYMVVSCKIEKILRSEPEGEMDPIPERIETLDVSAEFNGAQFFYVASDDAARPDPLVQARKVDQLRRDILTKPHVLENFGTGNVNEVVGFVLCYGALIHHRQDLEGISLIPYGQGLDYSSFLSSGQAFTLAGFERAMRRDDGAAADFARETPTIGIVFHRIHTNHERAALDYIIEKAADLLVVIGIETHHRPTMFGAFLWDGVNYRGAFIQESFRGNLLSPFDPNELGKSLDFYIPRMNKSPRVRLILETYAQALNERNIALKYFRFWALLEFLASDAVRGDNDAIFDSHGKPLLRKDGKAVLTSGAAAKVYKYLFDAGLGSLSVGNRDGDVMREYVVDGPKAIDPTGAEVFSMWDIVNAIYEIRNQVAHTGAFLPDPLAPIGSRLHLASRLFDHPSHLLPHFLFDMTGDQVRREIQSIQI